VTIISSITGPAASSIRAAQEEEAAAPSISLGMPALAEIPERTQPISPLTSIPVSAPSVAYNPEPESELEADALAEENPIFEPEPTNDSSVFEPLEDFEVPFVEDEPIVPAYAPDPVPPLHRAPVFQADPEDGSDLVNPIARAMGGTPEHGFGSPPPFPPQSSGNEVGRVEALTESSQKITLSRVFGSGGTGRIKTRDPLAPALDGPVLPTGKPHEELDAELTSLEARQQQEMLQLDPVAGRGRFAKTDPTIVDGEDLDVPTFLRKKK
jgi:cell division protein FtsZ